MTFMGMTFAVGQRGEKMDELSFTLSSPITEEQWDIISDVDFDNTNEIIFHTKHGKEVKFVKAQPEIIHCRDCKYWMPHTQLGYDEDHEIYHDYCKKLIPDDEYYAFARRADDFCSRAERRTDEC